MRDTITSISDSAFIRFLAAASALSKNSFRSPDVHLELVQGEAGVQWVCHAMLPRFVWQYPTCAAVLQVGMYVPNEIAIYRHHRELHIK